MVATPHMLAGAALATVARSPKRALALGVLSHLALDMVPHTDYQLRDAKGGLLVADLASATLLVGALCGGQAVLLAGAAGGALPDCLSVAEQVFGVELTRRPHQAVHTNICPPLWAGIATQVLTCAAGVAVLRAAARRR